LKWDYHVHLEQGPYRTEWLRKFLAAAREAGIDEIGFSEHAYRFRQTESFWPKSWGLKAEEDADNYVSFICTLKKEGYPVKLGVEIDFAPGSETLIDDFISTYPWDYVIGAVHFIDDWGFDRPDQAHLWLEQNILETYRRYLALFREAAQTKLFDIMAHPDVIKVFGYRPPTSLRPEYESCAETLLEAGLSFEINTAGLRKPVREIYPGPEFIKPLAEANIPAIISSDAHRPEDVGADFPLAYQYAREHGLRQLVRFNNRRRQPMPLD